MRIEIMKNGIAAGAGIIENGQIRDCMAVLGEYVYETLELEANRMAIAGILSGAVYIGDDRYYIWME